MQERAKRIALALLSLTLHGALLTSLVLFYLEPVPSPKKSTKIVKKTKTKKKIDDFFSNIGTYHKSIFKSILENKPQIPTFEIQEPTYKKEADLTTINFDVRLVALDAKVGDPVFIRIFKEESLLEIWIKVDHEYVLFKQYPICAFSGDLGPKLKEGDKQAPEGFYRVTRHLLNPNSKFHLSFNLGYPNAYDRSHKRTGSYLMVHGECVSIGCYAMTNVKMDEIYELVEGALKNGQKYVQVHAFPFHMTAENMSIYEGDKWYDFWTELKEGYDYFEAEKLPPRVKVKNRHYTIHEANE